MDEPDRAVVGLVRGEDRYDNVLAALEAIEDTIDLRQARRILIKPNLVSTKRQVASTHVDALRAVLEFLRRKGAGHVVIGETASLGATTEGYRNFGYLSLLDDYDVELVDLAGEGYVEAFIYDRQLARVPVSLSRLVVESDFRISVNPIKTHDTVVVTLAIKNMAMGALRERVQVHAGYPAINLSLYELARRTAPHLSVLDGFEGMEGRGPSQGDPVDLRVAVTSVDPVAADTVGTLLMEHDPQQVGYLVYCARGGLGQGDISRLAIRGNTTLAEARRRFAPHPTYAEQLAWRIPEKELKEIVGVL